MTKAKTVVLLTAPSCAGKTTLESALKVNGFVALISSTSRPPRAGEVNGKSYHFYTRSQIEGAAAVGKMAEMVEFGGNLYGLSEQEFDLAFATGKPVVAVVEPKGRDQIVAYGAARDWNVLTVFINNPIDLLFDRFAGRAIFDLRGGLKPLAEQERALMGVADRLKLMATQERSWVAEAMLGIFPYNFIINGFDERNTDKVTRALVVSSRQSKVSATQQVLIEGTNLVSVLPIFQKAA